MTSPPRSVAEAFLMSFEAGTRRIPLCPIFGRVRLIHEHGSALFLASFNPS